MQRAINIAQQGLSRGQSPFGCAIADPSGRLIVAHNTVVLDTDITAHAEINALREACRVRGDIHLTGCVVASTCEPCPMCMSALHWARVDAVYYGASIADATAAGFNELSVPAEEIVRLGNSPVQLTRDIMAEECRRLFSDWLAQPNRSVY
ncbi:MAG: nucleoside deaminase [Planctomycetales bacterium]|nr:nucleoside deaminase [Planctomycetales bacterium]